MVEYADDGRGFDPQAMIDCGMGLSNIASRVGSLGGLCEIASSKGHGMRATIRIALRSEPSPERPRTRRRRA